MPNHSSVRQHSLNDNNPRTTPIHYRACHTIRNRLVASALPDESDFLNFYRTTPSHPDRPHSLRSSPLDTHTPTPLHSATDTHARSSATAADKTPSHHSTRLVPQVDQHL